ncbi:hypothetical protein Sjap_010071 [Stephania japonica]|uniref:Uncharacterized protein n=1 Tax=Stephania japonica TaxID=461633 RepID=A0AAP0J8Q6_9MAGN
MRVTRATTDRRWHSHCNAFFYSPNSKIFKLFVTGSVTAFVLGVAIMVEWFAYGRYHHHQGFTWIVYYAPLVTALPILSWAVCLSIAIALYKIKAFRSSPSSLKPNLTPTLQPKLDIEQGGNGSTQGSSVALQRPPSLDTKTMSSIETKGESSRVPVTLATLMARSVREIMLEREKDNEKVIVKSMSYRCNSMRASEQFMAGWEGKCQVESNNGDVAFSFPLCYTHTLKVLKRSSSF